MSVDPTEALNKKYSELEEQFKKKRTAVEEEIAKNNEKVLLSFSVYDSIIADVFYVCYLSLDLAFTF